jgi:outer membrane protein OmpA-like peptidoglycan-associated protein
MINLKSSIIIVTLSALITSSGFSQKEAVILYNSQPVKVELSETGNISAFIGLFPGYMVGYKLLPTAESVNEPIITEKIVESAVDQNAGYAIVSSETIELQYKPNFATLDKALINKLNVIAARLKLNPKLKILITAHTGSQNQSRLSINRLASAIAYLGIKGISPDRIKSETQESANLIDVMVINYLS